MQQYEVGNALASRAKLMTLRESLNQVLKFSEIQPWQDKSTYTHAEMDLTFTCFLWHYRCSKSNVFYLLHNLMLI